MPAQLRRSATPSRAKSTGRPISSDMPRLAEEAGFDVRPHLATTSIRGSTARATARSSGACLVAIAHATEKIQIGTGVTCPTIRIHPAIIAQAAATTAAMMPGRFFLGVGTGENLNEHILGDKLAGLGRPRRDARGGHRGDARALERRVTSYRRRLLHGRERPALHAARDAPRRSWSRRSGERAAELAGTHRRRPDRHRTRGGTGRRVRQARRGKARATAN